jgi:2-keto-4-pentenoate hydratase/2-oxohepta-3-ene-1,7-dioic acid hydratase in catechol pathway
MKIARYAYKGSVHYGRLEGERLVRLSGSIWDSPTETGDIDPFGAVNLLSPVECPRIFGVGLNYVAHIAESGSATPRIPLLFMKPSTSAIGPEADIIYPREGQNVHFEAELAVVIGRKCRRVPLAEALAVVFGYTCANDISERVIQTEEMGQGALLIGKGYDTFCPLGPVIATGLDPTNLAIGARVNGQQRQASNSSDLLFSVAQLVHALSSAITLLPGDVIITGTPAGVGPIVPGDAVEIEVEGVGVLRNRVIAEP